MNLIYKATLVGLSALFFGGLCSCKGDGKDVDPSTVPSASVIKATDGDEQFKSTSAKFNMQTNLIEKLAYRVVEGKVAEMPDPVMIFTEAKEIIDITNPKQDVTIYGLEGGKTYTVNFAFKIKGENKYLQQSIEVTTPAYSQIITIVETGYNFVRVHIDVPRDDMYYRWVIFDRAAYEQLTQDYNNDDMLIVTAGLTGRGDTTFYLKDGDILFDDGEGNVVDMLCKPGMPMVALIAECDSTGYVDYEYAPYEDAPQKVSSVRPNISEYIDKVDDPEIIFNGVFARHFMMTRAPQLSTDEFKIKEKITERVASFEITPPSSVIRYGVLVLEAWKWNELTLRHAGPEGAFELILRDMQVQTGAINYVHDGLVKDSTYKLIVIGQCNEDNSLQIQYSKDFKPMVSDKPAIEAEVKYVENPNKDPFRIHFNVKAKSASAPVTRLKYLFNYVTDWNAKLASGEWTLESLLDAYGVVVDAANGADILAAINSAAGYNFEFNTWENSKSRLAIQTFNEDDKTKIYTADGTSLAEQAKPPVVSDLFTSLLGDWTATITFMAVGNNEPMTSRVKTTIAKGPEGADPNFFNPGNADYERVYNYYYNQGEEMDKEDPDAYAKEQIGIFHKEFVDLSAKYEEKYRGQNRLVIRDFQVNTHDGFTYKGAWELFCDPSYSSYDTEEIFYDYGPKMFIQIAKDAQGKDKMWIPSNPSTIPPFQSYSSWSPLSLIGSVADDDMNDYGGDFEVTAIDADNLKIAHKFKQDAKDYLMSFYTMQSGFASRVTYIVEDITLKRGFTPIAPEFVAPCAIKSVKGAQNHVAIKRTAFRPSNVPTKKFKEVKLKAWSYEESMKNSAIFQYLNKKRVK